MAAQDGATGGSFGPPVSFEWPKSTGGEAGRPWHPAFFDPKSTADFGELSRVAKPAAVREGCHLVPLAGALARQCLSSGKSSRFRPEEHGRRSRPPVAPGRPWHPIA